jgi:hypothetical protein
MIATLWLLLAQGLLGGFDTVYFHEWRARLPARRSAAKELAVHAVRDYLYAVLFISLPWLAWRGTYAAVLSALIIFEITLTFTDFVIEVGVRKSIGDVYVGERLTHAAMAIIYGAALANLVPQILEWLPSPSALSWEPVEVPNGLRWALVAMGCGVALSGSRDLFAAFGPSGASWPWPRIPE